MTVSPQTLCLAPAAELHKILGDKRKSILRHQSQTDSLSVKFGGERRTSTNRRVSFDLIYLYEHPVLLGDNPGGFRGPPLTLDWHSQACFEMALDDYEQKRPKRRTKDELALPPSVRIEILRQFGYARKEIIALTKPVNQARARRQATAQSLRLAGLEELTEKVLRGTFNALTLGQRKRKERKYLESCCILGEKPSKHKIEDTCPTAAFTEEDNSFGAEEDCGSVMAS